MPTAKTALTRRAPYAIRGSPVCGRSPTELMKETSLGAVRYIVEKPRTWRTVCGGCAMCGVWLLVNLHDVVLLSGRILA